MNLLPANTLTGVDRVHHADAPATGIKEEPIIVKFESQQIIGYAPIYNGVMHTTIENIGVSADGRRWRCYQTDKTSADGNTTCGRLYGFVELFPAPTSADDLQADTGAPY